MDTFIKKQSFNYIKKCLHDLNNTLRNCVEINVIEATKASLNEDIVSLFHDLSEEEKKLIDITKINDPLLIDKFVERLEDYVYGIPQITNAEIKKLFKKEKKLRLPSLEQDTKNVYLGWVDESIRKLFVVYKMNDQLLGMACRITQSYSNNTHICTLCNHVGTSNDVAFVSPICKTGENTYRSIGFSICLDSEKCNDRIVSVDKLENLLKNVNNIK